jgi:hypothetical protein
MVGRAGLEREAMKQVTADGVDREQAVYYHHEVMTMMLLCDRFGAAAGQPLSKAFAARLERMAEYLCALMDCGGHVPMIGDADDAHLLPLAYPAPPTPYAGLLASSALRFRRADFKGKAGNLDAATKVLWGPTAIAEWQALGSPPSDRPRLSFPHGGYYLLGRNYGTFEEVRAVVDCGPLGYLSIAAHGHADALAFTLSAAGNEVLIDPGTYAYHTNARWRDYFRGTSAHNTVRVDGADQSVPGGNFMWLRHAEARCESFDSDEHADRFSGSHDGYRRLVDPVTHWRQIVFDKVAQRVTVTDMLRCAKSHQVEVFWHFAEDFRVRVSGGHVHADNGRVAVHMAVDGAALQPAVIRAQEDPPLGWVSRRFDEKQPCPTVRWSGTVGARQPWTTVIQLEVRTLAAAAAHQVQEIAGAP